MKKQLLALLVLLSGVQVDAMLGRVLTKKKVRRVPQSVAFQANSPLIFTIARWYHKDLIKEDILRCRNFWGRWRVGKKLKTNNDERATITQLSEIACNARYNKGQKTFCLYLNDYLFIANIDKEQLYVALDEQLQADKSDQLLMHQLKLASMDNNKIAQNILGSLVFLSGFKNYLLSRLLERNILNIHELLIKTPESDVVITVINFINDCEIKPIIRESLYSFLAQDFIRRGVFDKLFKNAQKTPETFLINNVVDERVLGCLVSLKGFDRYVYERFVAHIAQQATKEPEKQYFLNRAMVAALVRNKKGIDQNIQLIKHNQQAIAKNKDALDDPIMVPGSGIGFRF